jgi:hypothetical protein
VIARNPDNLKAYARELADLGIVAGGLAFRAMVANASAAG